MFQPFTTEELLTIGRCAGENQSHTAILHSVGYDAYHRDEFRQRLMLNGYHLVCHFAKATIRHTATSEHADPARLRILLLCGLLYGREIRIRAFANSYCGGRKLSFLPRWGLRTHMALMHSDEWVPAIRSLRQQVRQDGVLLPKDRGLLKSPKV